MTTATAATSAAIPLTTVFTPPASCTSVNWVSSDCLKSTCDGVYNIVQTTNTECYPSGWATTATWFSPGLYCPTGYTVNDTNVVTSGLGITETQARCCPSGYTFATQLKAPWWTPEPCTKISTTTTVIEYTVLGATPTTTTAITYKSPIIHAYPIELRWQSTDSVDAVVKSSATVELTSSSATSTSTSTSSSTGSASASSGLSTGAKAGIGVGIAAAATIVIILSLLFWFRRRKNQKASSIQPSAGHARDGSIFKKTHQQEPVELPTYTPELHGSFSPASELDSDRGFSDRGFSDRGYSEHGHSEGTRSEFGQIESQMQRSPRA